VTGGAGFIGSALVRRLLRESQDHVVVLDALTYAGNRDNLPADEPRLTLVHQDIGDRQGVLEVLRRYECRAALNLAAETHVDRSIDAPAAFIETNVLGVQHLLAACLAYWRELQVVQADWFRFLHVSTDEVYGSIEAPGRARPGDLYRPSSPYSASKAAADHLVRAYQATYGLPTILVMPTNCYGPRQFPEKLIPLMACRATAGEPLPLYGDGRHVRQWLHVDDAAAGLHQALLYARPGDTHHLRGDASLENRELLAQLCRVLDELAPGAKPYDTLIQPAPDRPGHDRRYALDDEASRAQLKWRAEVPFEEGLRSTALWLLENEDWINHSLHRAMYHRERLGLG
ncbi:MAG: dTDP-glucose 4,6-dehydratase, partial [Planctomycetales bacterium]|nr:dTDP-glucose 4,6-dehydratase [Planctomycetales bacterium]